MLEWQLGRVLGVGIFREGLMGLLYLEELETESGINNKRGSSRQAVLERLWESQ